MSGPTPGVITTNRTGSEINFRKILTTWWPLAASWLMMGTELPVVSAIIARLPDPEINLAAYGGVVFALALVIEAPIIMLLAASTALSADRPAYDKLRRFMHIAGGSLTLLHILIAFTPVFNFVVADLIGAPSETLEPARIGLQIMTPWTWAIAYRRFNQGVLIRYGHSKSVGVGTGIRLGVNFAVLIAGFAIGRYPGIVVGPVAVIAGILVEAIYVGLRVQPVLSTQLPARSISGSELSYREILDFYVPLAMTSLLFLIVQPLGSAALSRMPSPLESLAVWPVISGVTFMFRSLGVAFNEVVVALLDIPGSIQHLRRFTGFLAISVSGALLLTVATPIAHFWFRGVSGLSPNLTLLAQRGLWLVLLWPALSVFQNLYQGMLVYSRITRGVTESVIVFLLASGSVLWIGVLWGGTTGLYVILIAVVFGSSVQTLWLWIRSRSTLHLF